MTREIASGQLTLDRSKFSLDPPSPEEEKKSIILNLTKINFVDEIIVFKTSHQVLGGGNFSCRGTVTTFAKLDQDENITFDMFNVICSDCFQRSVIEEYKSEKAKQIVKDEKWLNQTIQG